MNKRALKSKITIADTLINLMESSYFSEITISEIAAYSNLSRRSFYRNFSSKMDVLHFKNEIIIDEYLEGVNRRGLQTVYEMLSYYFEFWYSKKEYINLLKRNNVQYVLFEVQRKVFIEKLPFQNAPWHWEEIDETIIDLIFIGGLWNVLNYYLDSEKDIDPKKLALEVVNNLKHYIKYV